MANKLLVSIVCVTYKHEQYIAQAIESFLMQKTSFSTEIIIGVDFSVDKTRKICEDYKKKYPSKIRLKIFKKNVGASRNFLETINATRGKYIAYCDGDDYWTDPYKLQKQIDFLEDNTHYSSCSHNLETIFESPEGAKILKKIYPNPIIDASFDDLVKRRLFIGLNSYVFKKKAILNFPKWLYELPRCGHHAIIFLVSSMGLNHHIMETMGLKRKNPGGVTQNLHWKNIPKIKYRIILYENLRKYFKYKKDYVLIPVLLKWYRKQIIMDIINFNFSNFFKHFFRYLDLSKSYIKFYFKKLIK